MTAMPLQHTIRSSLPLTRFVWNTRRHSGLFAPSAAMPPIHRLGSGWKIHGLGRTMPIFLWQERSVNKCGFMKRNWNFLWRLQNQMQDLRKSWLNNMGVLTSLGYSNKKPQIRRTPEYVQWINVWNKNNLKWLPFGSLIYEVWRNWTPGVYP